MSREPAGREEDMLELLRADTAERTSAGHDAAVLSAARAYTESGPVRLPGRTRSRAVIWAAAASIAAIAISLALAWQVLEQRRALSAASADRAQLTRLVAGLEEQVATLERRSEDLTEALKDAQAGGAARPETAISAIARVLATVALSPGLVRGEDERVVIRAPQGEGAIRLLLDLDSVAEHDAYRVVVATTAGKAVWRSGAVAPQREGARKRLIIDAPASALPSADYEVTLRAASSGEELTYYYFELARQ